MRAFLALALCLTFCLGFPGCSEMATNMKALMPKATFKSDASPRYLPSALVFASCPEEERPCSGLTRVFMDVSGVLEEGDTCESKSKRLDEVKRVNLIVSRNHGPRCPEEGESFSKEQRSKRVFYDWLVTEATDLSKYASRFGLKKGRDTIRFAKCSKDWAKYMLQTTDPCAPKVPVQNQPQKKRNLFQKIFGLNKPKTQGPYLSSECKKLEPLYDRVYSELFMSDFFDLEQIDGDHYYDILGPASDIDPELKVTLRGRCESVSLNNAVFYVDPCIDPEVNRR